MVFRADRPACTLAPCIASPGIATDIHRAATRDWAATDIAGVERCLFRNHEEGGRTSVVRLQAGSLFPRHRHEAGEDVLVIAGRVVIGGAELAPGDYLYAAPGEEHDVQALTDAVIFVSSPRPTPLLA